MAKPEDELIADLTLSRAGRIAKYKHAEKMANAPKVQRLSEVAPNGHLIFPHKYLRQYEALKLRDPIAAETFYNQCLYDPRPKAVDPFAREKKILSRVGEEVKPLRRRI